MSLGKCYEGIEIMKRNLKMKKLHLANGYAVEHECIKYKIVTS